MGKKSLQKDDETSAFFSAFNEFTSIGAGKRTTDGTIQPWTPKELAYAISQLPDCADGVEVRTVQLWFKGQAPSTKNIARLATVFASGDNQNTAAYLKTLLNAKAISKLKAPRSRDIAEEAKQPETEEKLPSSTNSKADHTIKPEFEGAPRSIVWADRTEKMFDGPGVLHLPIYVWAGCLGLGISAYLLGLHDVSYALPDGRLKQVGYFWSPNWTVQQLILIPFLLITVSAIVDRWKSDIRPHLGVLPKAKKYADWPSLVQSYNLAFWLVLFLPLSMVFGLQWFGIYLPGLLTRDPGNAAVDWILAAPFRIDRPLMPAVLVSFIAMIYSSMTFWMFLASLLFQYITATDLSRFRSMREDLNEEQAEYTILSLVAMSYDTFKCAILGILMASCIKLNGAYMISNSSHVFTWIRDDALATLGLSDRTASEVSMNPLQYFTSTILVCLSCFVFAVVLKSTARASTRFLKGSVDQKMPPEINQKDTTIPVIRMTVVIVLLVTNFLLIGQVPGFSMLLFLTVGVAFYHLVAVRPFSAEAHQKVLNYVH